MGNKLFSEVTNLTGLPEELIGAELKQLLSSKGVSAEQMTMESLREALAHYLEEIHASMTAEEEKSSEPEVVVSADSGEPKRSRLPTQ